MIRIGKIRRCVVVWESAFHIPRCTAVSEWSVLIGGYVGISRRSLSGLKERLAEIRWRMRTGRRPIF